MIGNVNNNLLRFQVLNWQAFLILQKTTHTTLELHQVRSFDVGNLFFAISFHAFKRIQNSY
jgi:hypothetical protein